MDKRFNVLNQFWKRLNGFTQAPQYETLLSSLIIYFYTLLTCVLDKAQKKHSVPRWLQSVCEVQLLLSSVGPGDQECLQGLRVQ